ncbi:MAG: hypothetical protein R3300_03135 [Candidatus Promineifilaceae bacterium]|nr:hypothetical protein [Candidatus Promineifilaceae bacterium]
MERKSEEELRGMHWRERYAYEARRKFEAQRRLSESQLVERIEGDNVDPYFATWRAIARKGTVENAAMALWRYLQRHGGKAKMLHRYHCAAALFQILGQADPASDNPLRRRVQWDHEGEEARQEALLELKALIAARLPPAD